MDGPLVLTAMTEQDRQISDVVAEERSRLRNFIRKRVPNDADVEDLLQEVFLLIQRRAFVFDSSKGTPRSLIVHMTYQRALSRRRFLNLRHGQDLLEAHTAKIAAPAVLLYDESFKAHFSRADLRKVLEEMSEDQRQTLRLYFIEGYTFREIAGRLGQTPGNVSHHYYRALERLRRHLPKSQPGGRKSGQF